MTIRIKNILPLLILGLACASCIQSEQNFLDTKNAYLGLTPPGLIPEVFAPNIVSDTSWHEHCELAISPKGDEIYWSKFTNGVSEQIYFSKFINNKWTEPKLADFINRIDNTTLEIMLSEPPLYDKYTSLIENISINDLEKVLIDINLDEFLRYLGFND